MRRKEKSDFGIYGTHELGTTTVAQRREEQFPGLCFRKLRALLIITNDDSHLIGEHRYKSDSWERVRATGRGGGRFHFGEAIFLLPQPTRVRRL
jgi:hypothetical protein